MYNLNAVVQLFYYYATAIKFIHIFDCVSVFENISFNITYLNLM